MIARVWQGRVPAEKFDAYTVFTRLRAIPDYQKTPGFIRLSFLNRVEGNVGYFLLITYWQNLECIKNFAGEDVEKAKYYPEDEDFLLEFDEKVMHFEVFA